MIGAVLGAIALSAVAAVVLVLAIDAYITYREQPRTEPDDTVLVLDDPSIPTVTEAWMRHTEQWLPLAPQWADEADRERNADRLRAEYADAMVADYRDDMPAYVDALLGVHAVAWSALLATVGPRAARACAAEMARVSVARLDGDHDTTPELEAVLLAHGWRP